MGDAARRRHAFRAALLAVALGLGGCGEPDAGRAPVLEPQAPADPLEVQNSGTTLSGVYTLEAAAPPVVSARLTFTEEGEYERRRAFAGESAEREDAGTYVVDTEGRLVLWRERVGDALLSAAVPELLGFSGDPATGFAITAPDGRTERYARSGDAPRAARGAN